MKKKRPSPGIASDDEDQQAALERLAKQMNFQSVEELHLFCRDLFPNQPTYLVSGEEADGRARAFLVEGESESAASELLARYLSLLHLGANSVLDDPCNASFSAKIFCNCRHLTLLTRREVDAVNCRFNEAAR